VDTVFQSQYAGLAAVIAAAGDIEGLAGQGLDALRRKFDEHAFHLVVAGEFKRGKSTLINALLGADLLPTGVVPLTSVVTLLRHEDSPAVHVRFDNGEQRIVPVEALADYVTERGNPENARRVSEVVVGFPSPWLRGGLRLVDTPGVGSVHGHNSDVTRRFLPMADAVIFVVSADQPLGRNELDFLEQVQGYAGKVFCLLNKVDYLSADERRESLAFTRDVLHRAIGADVPLFAVSARQAQRARTEGDGRSWAESGMAAFDQALRGFLLDEGGRLWLASMRRQVLRRLAEARLALALEKRSLASPWEAMEKNLRAFDGRKAELQQIRSDLDALLEADGRMLLRQRVEPDLAAFKARLHGETPAKLDAWHDVWRSLGAAELQARLEQRLVEEIRSAFDAWRPLEDVVVTRAFDEACSRHWRKLGDAVDDLLRYSAELFAVPFTAVATDAPWQARSRFYYKFWEEPSTFRLLGRGLMRLLPAALGHPLVLRRMRARAAALVEMQSGRVRHDFDERIRKNLQTFRQDMDERIAATLAGIEAAIAKGRQAKAQGQAAAASRCEALSSGLDAIQALESRLAPTDEAG
jgi:GTP-binding protein EngB required for normal cell division